MDNPPTLDISSSTFNYNSLSTQSAITSAGSMAINMDVNANDHPNELDSGSTSSSLNNTSIQSTFLTNSDISNTNKHINILQTSFSPDYIWPVTILVEKKENFPRLNDYHHYFNSRKTKQKSRPPFNKDKVNLPVEPHFSSPNGSCLTIFPNQSLTVENKSTDLSWVHSLSLKLSESLINSPSPFSHFSPASHQSLIESSQNSLLNFPVSNVTSD
ncbi:hypothetical protein ACI65C_001356 [Semiaphis heraclei]